MLSGTAAFGSAAAMSRIAPLLLLPLFTRLLTPSEYGQIGVLATISALVATVASLGLETPMLRGYIHSRSDPHANRVFIDTVGAFVTAFAFALAVALAIAAGGIASAVGVPVDALKVTLIGAAATATATVVPLALLRAQERIGDYLRLSIVSLVATFGLAILLVTVFQMGIMGWVLASAVGGIATLGVGLVVLGHRWSWNFDLGALKGALRLGIPLVPHALAHWGLAVSDRLILGALVAAALIGPYFVAYQACGVVFIIAGAMSQSMQPMFAEAARSEALRRQLARTSTIHAIVVCLSAGAVALVGPPLIQLVLPAAYGPSGDYVPWMALGFAFFGLYLIPMNAISVMVGRTELVWLITILAAAANIGINLVFVPIVGPIAAAISTAIGYGLLLVGVVAYMGRVVPDAIPFERRRIAFGIVIVLGSTILALLVSPPEPTLSLAIGVSVLAVAAAVIGRVMFRNELAKAAEVLRSGARARAQ